MAVGTIFDARQPGLRDTASLTGTGGIAKTAADTPNRLQFDDGGRMSNMNGLADQRNAPPTRLARGQQGGRADRDVKGPHA